MSAPRPLIDRDSRTLSPRPPSSPHMLDSLSPSTSPRPHRLSVSRLPSSMDIIDPPDSPLVFPDGPSRPRPSIVHGFSVSPPPPVAGYPLPVVPEHHQSLHRPTPLPLGGADGPLVPRFTSTPRITTPVEQIFAVPYSRAPESPAPPPAPSASAAHPASPRPRHADVPRSRRNSAVVSIGLASRSSDRSASHTPRGADRALGGSGQATPSDPSGSARPRDRPRESPHPHHPRRKPNGDVVEEMEDWQPEGGMLLDEDGYDSQHGVFDGEFEDGPDGEDERGSSESGRSAERLPVGTIFGEGVEFHGEIIRPAVDTEHTIPLRRGGSEIGQPMRTHTQRPSQNSGKMTYQVMQHLGSGSYASVYKIKELKGAGREFAMKVLDKEGLTDDQLQTQLYEAHIHLSLPVHQNIVTLHQTLQTSRRLFLLLEYCPGEDLFYWLQKPAEMSPPTFTAKLHDDPSVMMSSSRLSSSSVPFSTSQILNHMPSSFVGSSQPIGSPASLLFGHTNGSYHSNGHHSRGFVPSQTPPTPALLSALTPQSILSGSRLRLIASMFSQMCEAVAVCHDIGVAHRDIKPENFMCCDNKELKVAAEGSEFAEGIDARKRVVVKLTDFGLATTERDSTDMECGSRPYMAYECRNNIDPSYRPIPSDVWSLGIVLLNMLYQRNPWTDPNEECANFDDFCEQPIGFLMRKFTGIGLEVATFLAERVLCMDWTKRATAREFGQWAKRLPEMIGGSAALRHLKANNAARHHRPQPFLNSSHEDGLFAKSPVGPVHDMRKVSASGLTSSAPITAASLAAAPEITSARANEVTPDLDGEEIVTATTIDEQPTPYESEFASPEATSPTTPDGERNAEDAAAAAQQKRRKRGVRKGKAAQAALAAARAGNVSQADRDADIAAFAAASQSFAREVSKITRSPESSVIEAEEFPPLGTTPAQVVQAKKAKWKDLMKLSNNPDLTALRQRVAERDYSSGGNWSAPAALQQVPNRSTFRPTIKQTNTISTGISSTLSSFGPVSMSSATSSSGDVEEDEWRRREKKDNDAVRVADRHADLGKRDEDPARARKAALAAAALAGGMGPMGSFGRPPVIHPPLQKRESAPAVPSRAVAIGFGSGSEQHAGGAAAAAPAFAPRPSAVTISTGGRAPLIRQGYSAGEQLSSIADEDGSGSPDGAKVLRSDGTVAAATTTTTTRPSLSTGDSGSGVSEAQGQGQGRGGKGRDAQGKTMDKPKLQGQIKSLARMLGGLKTKGKE